MNKPFLPLSREEIAIRALGLRRDPLAGELIALEPRMVFDGAGLAVATDAAKQASDAVDATKTEAGKTTSDTAAELAKTIAAAAVPMPAPSVPMEVVFIDSRVTDIDSFKKTAGDNRLVVVVDAKEDGISKITETLKGRHDISAVHIVGHGVDGSFALGKDWIGVDAIKSHDADIKSWQAALTANADILLYGCDVAKTTKGEELIKLLAEESGADVAASADIVGRTSHGADWTLEKTTGAIEAKTISPDDYSYKLAQTASVFPNGLFDNQRPNNSASTGYELARSITYTRAAAVQNVTNDLTPTVRGEDGIVGATTKLYLFSADGTSRTLVATSVVSTISGKPVYLLTYGTGSGVSNVPTLVNGGTYQFVVTQTVTGSDESPVTDAGRFWLTIDTTAPTQYTSGDSASLTTRNGSAIANNSITFNGNSNNAIRIYLTDQQVRDLTSSTGSESYLDGVGIRAGYFLDGKWTYASSYSDYVVTKFVYTPDSTPLNNTGIVLDTNSNKYYVVFDPTKYFPGLPPEKWSSLMYGL